MTKVPSTSSSEAKSAAVVQPQSPNDRAQSPQPFDAPHSPNPPATPSGSETTSDEESSVTKKENHGASGFPETVTVPGPSKIPVTLEGKGGSEAESIDSGLGGGEARLVSASGAPTASFAPGGQVAPVQVEDLSESKQIQTELAASEAYGASIPENRPSGGSPSISSNAPDSTTTTPRERDPSPPLPLTERDLNSSNSCEKSDRMSPSTQDETKHPELNNRNGCSETDQVGGVRLEEADDSKGSTMAPDGSRYCGSEISGEGNASISVAESNMRHVDQGRQKVNLPGTKDNDTYETPTEDTTAGKNEIPAQNHRVENPTEGTTEGKKQNAPRHDHDERGPLHTQATGERGGGTVDNLSKGPSKGKESVRRKDNGKKHDEDATDQMDGRARRRNSTGHYPPMQDREQKGENSGNLSGDWMGTGGKNFLSSPGQWFSRYLHTSKGESEYLKIKTLELNNLKSSYKKLKNDNKYLEEQLEAKIDYIEALKDDYRKKENHLKNSAARTEENWRDQLSEVKKKHEAELSKLRGLHFRAIREADGGVEPINDDAVTKRFMELRDNLGDWARNSFKKLTKRDDPGFIDILTPICIPDDVVSGQLSYREIVQALVWRSIENCVFGKWLFGLEVGEEIRNLERLLADSATGVSRLQEWRAYTRSRIYNSPQVVKNRESGIDDLARGLDSYLLGIAEPRENKMSNDARLEKLRSIISSAANLATELNTQKAVFTIDNDVLPHMAYNPETMKEALCLEEPAELVAREAKVSCVLSRGWVKRVAGAEGSDALRICQATVKCSSEEH